jgi:hypothetical protein
VAFAGYALWGVQAIYEGSWELWAPECSGYTAIDRCHPIDAPLRMPPFDEADRQLRKALEAAIGFTRKAEGDFGVTYFTDALALRDARQPEIPDYPEFLPELGCSAEARRLLACASKAWVFGGMGSWNDLGFDDPELKAEYERLTPRLFDAVLNAIAAAPNAGER